MPRKNFQSLFDEKIRSKNSPKISVIMPVYNCEDTIESALLSILNQTESDFELLIWNDGSTDKTIEIIKRYSDPRVKLFESENRGLTFALNNLLELCTGKYICRMDGDDINDINRLAEQSKYLEDNPKVVLVGTGIYLFTGDISSVQSNKIICEHQSILDDIAFLGFPICHPSIMFRFTVVSEGIRYKFPFGEENDFFVNCVSIGELRNLEKPLLYYRLSPSTHSVGEKSLFHEKYWYKTSKFTYKNYCRRKSIFLNLLYSLGSNNPITKLFFFLKAKSRNYYRDALRNKIEGRPFYFKMILAILVCPVLIIRTKNYVK